MKRWVDYDATIADFFKSAIAWLEHRPMHLRNGVDKEKESYEYMKIVQSDPRRYTAVNVVYSNCDKLEGFIEFCGDGRGNLVSNNELYFAVVRTLDAIGKYYEVNYHYSKAELLASIKEFKIALNRNKLLKSTFYKMQSPYYFAQKQK